MIYQKWFAYIEIQRNPLTTSVPHHIETSRLICDWFLYDGEHCLLMGKKD